jgi:transcriptional antiterminator RfaH
MQQTTQNSSTSYAWYVVHCQSLRERQVAAALENLLGLATFLPEVRRRYRGQVQQAPFFPRYLFVQADLQEVQLSRINTAPGVLRLVSFGGVPQTIQASVVRAIREYVDHLNTHGGLLEHHFHPGETVRLTGGPMRGLEAIFMGPMKPSQRVQVLIEFMGHLRDAEIDSDLIERTNSSATPARERRTRGKGRRIRQNTSAVAHSFGK